MARGAHRSPRGWVLLTKVSGGWGRWELGDGPLVTGVRATASGAQEIMFDGGLPDPPERKDACPDPIVQNVMDRREGVCQPSRTSPLSTV